MANLIGLSDPTAMEQPNKEGQSLISLRTPGQDDTSSQAPVAYDVAKNRADKYMYVMGDGKMSRDSVIADVSNNNSNMVRDYVANQEALKQHQASIQLIKDIAANGYDINADPELMEIVKNLDLSQKPKDVELALERAVANKVTSDTFIHAADTAEDDTPASSSEHAIMDVANSVIARDQFLNNLTEDLNAAWDKSSTVGKGVEIARGLVPLFPSIDQQNAVEGADSGSFLGGSNREDNYKALDLIRDDAEFARQFRKAVDGIAKYSVISALDFINGYRERSATTEALGNLTNVADLALTIPLDMAAAKAAARSGSRESRFLNAIKTIIKTKTPNRSDTMEGILSAAGAVDQAAKIRVIKQALPKLAAKVEGSTKTVEEVYEVLSPLLKTSTEFDLTKSLSDAATQRLSGLLRRNLGLVDKILGATNRVARLDTPEAVIAAVEKTDQGFLKELPSEDLGNGVLRMRHIPAEETAVNLHAVEYTLGDARTGVFFGSEEEAQHWADFQYQLLPESYNIEPQGVGFVIKTKRNVADEGSDLTSLDLANKDGSPVSFSNGLLAYVRSADSQVSKTQNIDRAVAQYSGSRIQDLYKRLLEPVASLSRKEMKRFTKFAEYSQKWEDPTTGKIGKWFEDVNELNMEWSKLHGQFPTDKEVDAYYTYIQTNDLDYAIRNMNIYQQKASQGIKNVTFEMPGKVAHPEFEGVVRDRLPWNTKGSTFNSFVMDTESLGKPKVINSGDVPEAERAKLNKRIKDGELKIIQVANPESRPFSDTLGINQDVNFVLVKNVKTKELSPVQLPYRPGGHVEYAAEHYIKGSRTYTGANGKTFVASDLTLFPVGLRKQGDQLVERLREARKLYKAGDKDGLKAYLKANLPVSREQFHLMMKELGDNGNFFMVPKGQKIRDVHKTEMSNSLGDNVEFTSESPFNLIKNVTGAFSGERGNIIQGFDTLGKGNNPVFRLTPGQTLNPIESMLRGLRETTNSMVWNDYRVKAAREFVTQFEDVLSADPNKLRANPYFYFNKPEFRAGADPARLAAAKSNLEAMKALLGQPSDFGRRLDYLKHKTADFVYEKFGQEAAQWISDSALFKPMSTIRTMRAFAFHTQLGLFNPVQFWVQSQGVLLASVFAGKDIGGVYRDLLAMGPMKFAKSLEQLKEMAAYTRKLGGNPDHLVEMYQEMHNSGILNIAGSHAYFDEMHDPKVFKSTVGHILDKGAIFFNTAENYIRKTAYITAYRRWRNVNPKAAMTSAVRAQILKDADNFSMNMTQASTARWQRGFLSIPTQFMSYQARLAEAILGNKFSFEDRMKILGFNALMYGVPVGVGGGALGLYPWHEDIKQGLLERGIVPEDNMLSDILFNGIPDVMIKLATGGDYNFAERYGPGGIPTIKDILQGGKDGSFFNIVAGASGSVLGDVFAAVSPGVSYLANKASGGAVGRDHLPVDFVQKILMTSSTFRAIRSLNYNAYVSKNGTLLAKSERSFGQALLEAMYGLTPQKIQDSYILLESSAEQAASEKAYQKRFNELMTMALLAHSNNDEAGADAYEKEAFLILDTSGIKYSDRIKWMRQAIQGNDLVDNISKSWINKGRSLNEQINRAETIDQMPNTGGNE